MFQFATMRASPGWETGSRRTENRRPGNGPHARPFEKGLPDRRARGEVGGAGRLPAAGLQSKSLSRDSVISAGTGSVLCRYSGCSQRTAQRSPARAAAIMLWLNS